MADGHHRRLTLHVSLWLYAFVLVVATEDGECDKEEAEDPFVYRRSKVARQIGVTPFHDIHNRDGIKKAQASDMNGAEMHFRAAAFFSPYSSTEWSNFGRVLKEQAKSLQAGSQRWGAEELRRLREAVAAFDLAYWLGKHKTALQDRKQIMQMLQANYEADFGAELSACPADDCNTYQTMVQVFNAKPLTTQLLHAFCTPKNLKARLSDEERSRGFDSAQNFRLAWLALKKCGVVVVDGAVPPRVIDRVAAKVGAHFDATRERISGARPDILRRETPFNGRTSIQTMWDDVGERSKFRFEVKLPLEQPFTDEALTSSEPLLSLVKGALRSRRLELDTFSYVMSMAGAPAQHWHTDADVLFGDWQGDEIPPHGVVAAVALGTITKASGPTEFKLGTHLSSLKADGAELPTVAFAVDKGSAVLFDVRITHRGSENKTPRDRGLLYLSYVHEWWQDSINYRKPQTRGWDAHNTSRTRKLFQRLDAQAWTKALEVRLAKRGVDLDDLRSTFHPHPSTDLYV